MMATLPSTTDSPTVAATATIVARAAQVLAAGNPNPTTPPFSDDVQWITAYLAVHMLSIPSRRYSYLLWFVIAFLLVVFALVRVARLSSGAFGISIYKWAVRRPILRRGSHSSKTLRIFPSNSQLLSFFTIVVLAAIASCVGPDYIKPTVGTFNLAHRSSLERRKYWDPLQFVGWAPQYTISKAWWTAGGRVGMIAYTLFPLCVLFALKSPPFALFALPFTAGLHFDKLSFLHRWTGRLIWLLSTLHVIFWCLQLLKDRRTSAFAGSKSNSVRDKPFELAWSYIRFIYAWIAYGLLTLLQLFSIPWLRKRHYETFYFLHIILVPLTLVLAALHHPPIWWWCWAALFLWIGERAWRFACWLRINGLLGTPKADPSPPRFSTEPLMATGHHPLSMTPDVEHNGALPDSVHFSLPIDTRTPTHEYPPSPPRSSFPNTPFSTASVSLSGAQAYVPPPGWAHAELLAGNTVRLSYSPPAALAWAPGQHFLLCVPAVTRFTTHPFTVVSVSDEREPVGSAGRMLVVLVRAKSGWTKDLWDEVAALVLGGRCHSAGESLPQGVVPPRRGALMKMFVDGPFGSAVSADWGRHSTAVIVCGGSGVSFGISVLEFLCLCMAGRDGKELGGRPGGWGKPRFRTSRVRFVWLVREYSHVQWCASALRRCLEMIPPPGLQVDIFVTNPTPVARTPRPQSIASLSSLASPSSPTTSSATIAHTEVDSHLAPPVSRFTRRGDGATSGSESERSDVSSAFDLSYYASTTDGIDEDALDITDLTNWDGDNDSALPGERRLSRQVKQAGRHRRTLSRRLSQSIAAKPGVTLEKEKAGLRPPSLASRMRWSTRSTDKLLNQAHTMSPLAEEGATPSETLSEVPLGPLSKAQAPRSRSPQPHHRLSHPHHPVHPYEQAEHLVHGHSPLVPSDVTQEKGGSGRNRASWISNFPGSDEGAFADDTDSATLASISRPHTPNWDARSRASSAAGLLDTGGPLSPGTPYTPASPNVSGRGHSRQNTETDVRLEVEAREMRDLNVVSEFVRPGHPRLDRLLADEVERSQGALVVGCCGPASFNAVMRNAIARQINPSRVRKGDMRGSITLVAEDFEY